MYVKGRGFGLISTVVFEPSFIGTRALLGILAVGCFRVFTRSLHKVVGNCLSINHISCKYPCGAWVWVTGAIPHTHHGVCACLAFLWEFLLIVRGRFVRLVHSVMCSLLGLPLALPLCMIFFTFGLDCCDRFLCM